MLDQGPVKVPAGKANELRKVRLYEVSLVAIGANQDTSVVAVKTAARLLTRDADLALRLRLAHAGP